MNLKIIALVAIALVVIAGGIGLFLGLRSLMAPDPCDEWQAEFDRAVEDGLNPDAPGLGLPEDPDDCFGEMLEDATRE